MSSLDGGGVADQTAIVNGSPEFAFNHSSASLTRNFTPSPREPIETREELLHMLGFQETEKNPFIEQASSGKTPSKDIFAH